MAEPRQKVQRLLACDLDGTLIDDSSGDHDPMAPLRLGDYCRQRHAAIAYITGRPYTHALHGIDLNGLPGPDWLAVSCGTELYRGGITLEEGFANLAGGWNPGRIRVALSGLRLEPQCSCLQTSLKISYYGGRQEQVRQALLSSGIQARVLANFDPFAGRHQIDVIPHAMGKLAVLHYLQGILGLDTQQIVFAGNGGNDIQVFDSDYQSVVVGNSALKCLPERVHRAAGHYAAGVLEGAARWWD